MLILEIKLINDLNKPYVSDWRWMSQALSPISIDVTIDISACSDSRMSNSNQAVLFSAIYNRKMTF